jgi:hypothetical protein
MNQVLLYLIADRDVCGNGLMAIATGVGVKIHRRSERWHTS